MNEKYKMPSLGLFGKRCGIKNVHNMNDGFVYRIVNSGIMSNCWKEPPLGRWGNEPIQHDEMEEIVIVVCDTLIDDNSKLERVALKDIEIMEEQEPILDKIRAEIEQAADKQFQIAMGVSDLNERYAHIQMENAYRHSLNIIDKYKKEIEPQESEEV